MEKSLEIERKFLYNIDMEKKLLELGITKKETVEMEDEYFDNELNYFLLENDCWLRSRKMEDNVQWELKYPIKSGSINKSQEKNFSNYYELNVQSEIIDFIRKLAKNNSNLNNNQAICILNMKELVKIFDLKPFSKIKSARKSYVYQEFKIDLDETDFGYKVGEIEIMLKSNSNDQEIQNSMEKIDNLAIKLGIK